MGVWISSDVIGVFINKCNATDILFSNVKWSDEEPKEIVLKNDVEKQDNLDIPEEDDYCKYHFMILKKNSDGKLFCNDCLTNCIHRKTGTCNYLVKKIVNDNSFIYRNI